VEGEEKASGKAVYAVDVVLPRMLWGKCLRSPIPYGRIKRIDPRRALELPGVKAVLTGRDVAGRKIGRRIQDIAIIADDTVRFIGEKIAAVAAETEEIAEEAVNLIEVEYEELEPVFDPLEAIKPSAPLLHPDVAGYKGLPGKIEGPTNVFIDMAWKKGDIAEGFAQSEVIVENTFRTPAVHQAYIEPHSCVVHADPSGGAEIWSCSKVPFGIRDQVGEAVGVPPEKLVLRPCYIGGDFGGKSDFMDVAVCYLLSVKSQQPVKMVMDYEEEFIAGNPRHASVVRVKTGVRRDGRIVAHAMEFLFDSGAYGAFKPVGFLGGPQASAGPYRIPHVLIQEKIVYTNKFPCGHMRSPGDPQGFFANESQLDLIARKLGMDPVEFRRINLMRDGDQSPTGEVVTFIRAEETLEKAIIDSGYRKPKPKNVGRGVAVAHWLPNGGEGTVYLELDSEGAVTISTGMMDQGAGTYTVMRQIAAEELDAPLSSVRVKLLDTGQVPKDTGVGASRATRVYGNAAYQAASKLREEILKTAAGSMGSRPEELTVSGQGVLHPASKRRMSYGEIVKTNGGPLSVSAHYKDMSKSPEASMCVQVAEVEVDPETGQVWLRRFTTAHHTGTIINPLMHQGQIDGGVMMGIGYALMENLATEEGKVISANFGDYKIPTMKDTPPLKTGIVETRTGPGPYHSTAIGETPNIPTAAAIANAVHDAVGVRLVAIPIAAEDVFRSIRNGRSA
jgi:carbon-monoxide dehydrogenase large subunit